MRAPAVCTWELALAACVSTQSFPEWLLTHVGAASRETTWSYQGFHKMVIESEDLR